MLKDSFNSVFDNLKERTTNPFLGTLIVVWVLKNWTLVYSLFYFDSNFKLEDRLCFINQYFQSKSFLCNMLSVIGYTLAVLLITYILLSISRLLTDFYDRVVIPLVSKITDRSSVVLKSEYNKRLEDISRLEGRLEEERLAKVAAQNERDASDLRLIEKNRNEVTNTPTTIKTNDSALDRIQTKLLKDNAVSSVNTIIEQIKNRDGLLVKDPIVKLFLREDLIELDRGDYATGYAGYKFTDEGKEFVRKWNDSTSN